MTEKVLLVDDEANVLAGLKRQLRRKFEVATAESGAAALKAVAAEGPFAVAVCDMRMPGMNGIEVLGQLQKTAPDTVRMMLTGNADQQTAIDAVNQGNVFRFFTKPCSFEALSAGIEAGIVQYRLLTAERELLEHTLAGSVKVLVDVLAAVDPVAFSRAARVADWALEVSAKLGLKQPWKIKLAATIAPLGLVAIPPEVAAKRHAGEKLTKMEAEIVESFPELGGNFIANIPRLGEVAEIVRYHTKCFNGDGFPRDGLAGQDIPYEARVLKVLYDLAEDAETDHPTPDRFDILARRRGLYDPAVLADLKGVLAVSDPQAEEFAVEPLDVTATMLVEGDVLRRDLKTLDERLILAEGAKLKMIHIERIRGFVRLGILQEPIEILRRKVITPIASEVQW